MYKRTIFIAHAVVFVSTNHNLPEQIMMEAFRTENTLNVCTICSLPRVKKEEEEIDVPQLIVILYMSHSNKFFMITCIKVVPWRYSG